jgi:hypothetical protein
MSRGLVTSLGFVAGLSACTRSAGFEHACDDTVLERVVSDFEADPDTDAATRALLDGLLQACPTVHRGILLDLELSYVGGEPEQELALLGDQDYLDERERACANPHAWAARIPELPPAQVGPAMFDICRFERFALLEPGEPFLGDDLAGFVAADWLLRHGVDTTLTRRFARGLMFVSADDSLSLRRCLADNGSQACATLIRKHGAGLPVSQADWPILPRDQVTPVFLTATTTTVAELPLAHDGSIGALLAANLTRSAATDDVMRPDQLLVIADRHTPWARLIELMRAAHDNGYTEHALMVEHGDAIAQLPLATPAVWSIDGVGTPGGYGGLDGAGAPVFVIDEQSVHLPDGAGRVARADVARLEPFARRLAAGTNGRSLAIVRAAPTVELRTVVEVIDALRGLDCSLSRRSEEEPDPAVLQRCALWQVIVDLDPPTARRAGDWSGLRVSLAAPTPEQWGKRKGPMSERQLRTRVERALERIRVCLVESDEARTIKQDRFSFTFATGEDGQLGARVFGPFSDHLPEPCLVGALDLPLVGNGMQLVNTAFADVGVTIDVPAASATD